MAFEDMPEDCSFKQIKFDQIEQENPPLGFLNNDWNELCRLRQDRDELCKSIAPPIIGQVCVAGQGLRWFVINRLFVLS